ncbi:26S proteasome regulatory subunit 7 [Diplodia seriata]
MRDIQVLKTYGAAPYATELKKLEKEIKDKQQSVNEKIGVKVACSIRVSHCRHLTLSLGI